MNLEISKEANPNYLAKIVKLKGLRKHDNADRLQCVDINFQTVITGLDAKDGDVYVYFPTECKINNTFLSATNSFRDKNLNQDDSKTGFFEENCRVKTMRLRGEKSMGYIVPIEQVLLWAGVPPDTTNIDKLVDTDFDTINNQKLVEKYVVPTKKSQTPKEGKNPKVSRLIEGQVKLHVDTENLRRNAHKIQPMDDISISYKTHGTSWWVANVKVKKKLSWFERVLVKLGVNVQTTEYDHVYGSRKVVKNQDLDDPKKKDHFYGYDLWEDIKEEVKSAVPAGFTVYGEALGFTKNGNYIQKGYDYGASPGQMKLEVYRVTQTNEAGLTTELSHKEIMEFCERAGLTPSTTFFTGKACWVIPDVDILDQDWNEKFVRALEDKYNDKDCFMCTNVVPEEGIVVRKDNLFEYEAYKLKSFRFLEHETKELDKGVLDLESEN